MLRSTTKKTVRFFAVLMVAVLLATCFPLTVLGANEDLLPSEITQTTDSTAVNAGGISANESSTALTVGRALRS